MDRSKKSSGLAMHIVSNNQGLGTTSQLSNTLGGRTGSNANGKHQSIAFNGARISDFDNPLVSNTVDLTANRNNT